ncbi:hypothetical protein Tco_1010955, partial [Tanacetum coccineum]
VLVVSLALYALGMERGFLSQKVSGGGRGLELFSTVFEAHGVHSPACENDENMNDAATKVGPTPTGNTPGMYSYANVTGVPSRRILNFLTLFTPVGNGVVVVVLMESIRATSEWLINMTYGFFLGKRVAYSFSSIDGLDAVLKDGPCVPATTFSEDGLSTIATKFGTHLMLNSYTSDMCIQSYGRSNYARALIEVRADVELKDNIVVAMPKLVGEGLYTCINRVEYEWKPSSGNKKKDTEPTIVVSNSKSLDVLNLDENYVDLGKNGGTSKLASKKANSSGSSFWNLEPSSTSTTHMVGKINNIERLIIEGKVTLVDDDGKPLAKVNSLRMKFHSLITK